LREARVSVHIQKRRGMGIAKKKAIKKGKITRKAGPGNSHIAGVLTAATTASLGLKKL